MGCNMREESSYTSIDHPYSMDQSDLAIRAQTDEQAFTELYTSYFDEIYRFVVKRIGHRETSEDIVSDIFRKTFLHLDTFNPAEASFRTWVYRIAHNTLIDFYRTRNTKTTQLVDIDAAEDVVDTSDPQGYVINQEARAALRACMTHLPDAQRQIVELKYFDEFSNQEIGELLHISANTVGVNLHRALKKLTPFVEHIEL